MRVHATPTGGLDLEEDGSDDWLHNNPTYIRQTRSAKHVQDVLEPAGSHEEDSSVPTSFISGRSIEPLGIANMSSQY